MSKDSDLMGRVILAAKPEDINWILNQMEKAIRELQNTVAKMEKTISKMESK